MRLRALVLAAAAACACLTTCRGDSMVTYGTYESSSCVGTPELLFLTDVETLFGDYSCTDYSCVEMSDDVYAVVNCSIADRETFATYVAETFSSSQYLIMEIYSDASCSSVELITAFSASGSCRSGGDVLSVLASLAADGSAEVEVYTGGTCDGEVTAIEVDSSDISSGTCIDNDGEYLQFTTSTSTESATNGSSGDASSGLSTSALIGIIVGVLVVVFAVAGFAFWRYRVHKKLRNKAAGCEVDDYNQVLSPIGRKNGTLQTDDTASSNFRTASNPDNSTRLGSRGGLWDDEIIIAARIPREKISMQKLINRGGGGEVYMGQYNGAPVAVKVLLSATRKNLQHVNAFLAEIKLMAVMEHPRIVEFVGVAWDSLTDLCAVSEYMEGGDLRELLAKYKSEGRPVGFDRTKVSIALHVAHALTYLHSLDPPVLHRDLKSKNILLTAQLEAKLTDFGISRENADRTMTAGVGTSLWMAPEVMMGERYDDKADMFSFGVVLSELDLHVLPYSHAKEIGGLGRKMPDAAVLQNVALGKIQVEFSGVGPATMKALGLACVSLSASERPTAAEALYELQRILAKEL